MQLSRRASVLIFPVILTSYALAALGVYSNLRETVVRHEQGRLENKLSELQSSFSLYSTFVDAYLISLVEGNVLGEFLKESGNFYREKNLSNNLQSAVRRFRHHSPELVSVSVIGPKDKLVFYAENSTDPFSSVRPEQLALASSLFAEGKLVAWEHVQQHQPAPGHQGSSIILQAHSIDTRTLAPPLPTQLDHTIQVIVAAEPAKFDQLLKQVEADYGATAQFSNLPQATDTSSPAASIALKPDYYLSIEADPSYLAAVLNRVKTWMATSVGIASFITFIVLQLLIRRYVTQPIARLDEQLTAVLENRRENIDPPPGDDEVTRLGHKFYKLYEDLTQAFQYSRRASLTDALTQLPNRSAFYDAAVHQLAEAEGQREIVSFIYIDLDNFKFVNDKYGHEIGDELLKAVAVRLQHLLVVAHHQGPEPTISRLSGDEFIVMLPSVNSEESLQIGEKILNIFARGYHFELGSFPVTASLGLACFPEDGSSLSQLISNADIAMYEAKKSGKNKLARYSQTLAKAARRQKEVETSLKELDMDAEFHLQYMPIVNSQGEITHCEALLRWNSPSLGLVTPDEFIPIAETTGLFESIDFWVIKQAHLDFHALRVLLGPKVRLAINISSAELNTEHFVEKLQQISQQSLVATSDIEFEITETFAIASDRMVMNSLKQLRQAGYTVAIDDFGTGYTSLMQMLDYPVDKIKLDKDFIQRITDPEKQSLLAPLIDLCHLQGLQVTAEGVETATQQSMLWQAKCDFLQGYLIAKPMPLDQIAAWTKDTSTTSGYPLESATEQPERFKHH